MLHSEKKNRSAATEEQDAVARDLQQRLNAAEDRARSAFAELSSVRIALSVSLVRVLAAGAPVLLLARVATLQTLRTIYIGL